MVGFQVHWQMVGEPFLKVEWIPSIHVTEVTSYMWVKFWVQVLISVHFALNFKNPTKLASSLPTNQSYCFSKSLNSKPEMDDPLTPLVGPMYPTATGGGGAAGEANVPGHQGVKQVTHSHKKTIFLVSSWSCCLSSAPSSPPVRAHAPSVSQRGLIGRS